MFDDTEIISICNKLQILFKDSICDLCTLNNSISDTQDMKNNKLHINKSIKAPIQHILEPTELEKHSFGFRTSLENKDSRFCFWLAGLDMRWKSWFAFYTWTIIVIICSLHINEEVWLKISMPRWTLGAHECLMHMVCGTIKFLRSD